MRSSTKQTLLQSLVPAYLAVCIVLGGASAQGFAANMLLQLLAIPIIWVAIRVTRDVPMLPAARGLLWLTIAGIGLCLIQLVPLPPSIWTTLPNRRYVADGFTMLDVALPWLPLSLAPRHTLQSLLWLLPALAVLLGILRVGAYRATSIAWVLGGMAIVSTLVGATQLLGGMNSPAYFYRHTNFGVAVGFFSNANHLATMLLITTPFLAALIAVTRHDDRRRSSGTIITLVAMLLVALVGLALSGSLAGVGLGIPVAVASLFLVRINRKAVPIWGVAALLLLAAGSVAVVMSQPFDNNLTARTARDDTLSRYTSFTQTYAAAKDYFPAGSGVGSFLQVYRQYEDPARTITTYVNHAHNDLLELLLEAGLPGVLLVLVFLVWWVRQVLAAWFDPEADPFTRAATIASGAVIAHSLVDYPLRTAAISALFAMCLSLMARPRERTLGERKRQERAARHLVA